ncbi:hypothetical protein Golomagni_05425 [Golovinomyces magnicellulatus]|nr:hypothetical protein Golomagni_05425 [Golovinomyces magnicellulatus]
MKYGEQLQRESVPEWSLHNLDYNSLKHEIKVHTTRDQATAIAIPGHQDTSLRKFEDALYLELCRQHDRVDMFVSSKADEISRRLAHINTSLEKYAQVTNVSPLKRQRRFAKLERDLRHCDNDIHALARFSNAQVTAFRKILKKYKKWTGSTSLTSRINDFLSNPKSFTRQDFSPLAQEHARVLDKLRESEPQLSEPSSPDSAILSAAAPNDTNSARVTFDPLPPAQMAPQLKYWNEYDDGSEVGDGDDHYAIYINPDDDDSFPGYKYVAVPFEKFKSWFKARSPGGGSSSREEEPLLVGGSAGYSSTTAHTDSEEEGYDTDGIPSYGFSTHYAAFPSVDEQRVKQYQERVFFWATIGCFLTSFVLIGICGVLISAGRHRLRVEVDAGVTIGVMVSLFCSCAALGMTLYREEKMSVLFRASVWSSFIASCLLNGMLLVLVAGNAP